MLLALNLQPIGETVRTVLSKTRDSFIASRYMSWPTGNIGRERTR